MRVWDTEHSIFDGLQRLPRRRYLCAMWILCGELRTLYSESLAESERSLMASTLDLVREIVIRGDSNAEVSSAIDMALNWERLAADRATEVSPGQWNALATFRNLAGEIAGRWPQYEASQRLTLAATDRWRVPTDEARRIDPDEVVDDATPMAETLATFERVVAGVGRTPESEWDPLQIRTKLVESGAAAVANE